MQLITTQAHQGEGTFPLFPKGSAIHLLAQCKSYANWYKCEIEGHQFYAPIHFIENNRLLVDYNPTELVVTENEIVELIELHYEWALVKKNEQIGWLPCEILKTR